MKESTEKESKSDVNAAVTMTPQAPAAESTEEEAMNVDDTCESTADEPSTAPGKTISSIVFVCLTCMHTISRPLSQTVVDINQIRYISQN